MKLSKPQKYALRTIYENGGWGTRPTLLSDCRWVARRTWRVITRLGLVEAADEMAITVQLTLEGKAIAEGLPVLFSRYWVE